MFPLLPPPFLLIYRYIVFVCVFIVLLCVCVCVFVCTRARACIKKTELPHATSFNLQSIAAFVFADLHNIPIYGDVAPLHLSPLIEGPETRGCDASHNHRVEVNTGR